MPAKKENISFEDAIIKLEDIVTKLEKGEVSLEDSLKLFEEGCKLSGVCSKLLDTAEQKVLLYSKSTEQEKDFE